MKTDEQMKQSFTHPSNLSSDNIYSSIEQENLQAQSAIYVMQKGIFSWILQIAKSLKQKIFFSY